VLEAMSYAKLILWKNPENAKNCPFYTYCMGL
jgi:hypothetical protein